MAISGPKQPVIIIAAAIAKTAYRIGPWWTMKRIPCRMSIQIPWMRLRGDSVGAAIDAGRRITTDAMSAADTRKLIVSSA